MRIESTQLIFNIVFSANILPQSLRKETFWMPADFESNEKSVILSNAQC